MAEGRPGWTRRVVDQVLPGAKPVFVRDDEPRGFGLLPGIAPDARLGASAATWSGERIAPSPSVSTRSTGCRG